MRPASLAAQRAAPGYPLYSSLVVPPRCGVSLLSLAGQQKASGLFFNFFGSIAIQPYFCKVDNKETYKDHKDVSLMEAMELYVTDINF